MENDSRYPYTHSCDYIRNIVGYDINGMKLSRSEASRIRSKIAEIIGMPDNKLAEKIADEYLKEPETPSPGYNEFKKHLQNSYKQGESS